MEQEFRWADELNCAVTVCDTTGIILYMNEKASKTFATNGSLIGTNLMNCHSERSQEIICEMLTTGRSHSYTIEKQGIRKMIYQTPWRKDGVICGLVEISMEIPAQMPHYIRG